MAFNRNDDDNFQKRSLLGILMSPFRAVSDWVKEATSGDPGFRSSEGFSPISVLTFPFRMLWGFLVFMVQAWSTSRNGIAFLRGLPAFSILLFTPFLLWVLHNYSRNISLGPTLGYHQLHTSNQAWDEAKLFSQKLIELRPDSDEYKYLHAENINRTGDLDGATRLMSYLAGSTELPPEVDPDGPEAMSDEDSEDAQEESTQYSRAHIWLSQQLIRQQRVEAVSYTHLTLPTTPYV